ncbi:hypothetical protein DdX_11906 [Ditylenchus destructor]|uniref:Uncharacterized protein n=1 Tax=Ditylenchus destructor TaxID=166010 RepID=A0AAD4MY91_9BILA|nr:hypothetical protein DdX_11906 [Ditylenchus destructor]
MLTTVMKCFICIAVSSLFRSINAFGLSDISSSFSDLVSGTRNARKTVDEYKKAHLVDSAPGYPWSTVSGSVTPDQFHKDILQIFKVTEDKERENLYTFNLNNLSKDKKILPWQITLAKLTEIAFPKDYASTDFEFPPFRRKNAIEKALKLYAILQHYYAYKFSELDQIKKKSKAQNDEMKEVTRSFLYIKKKIKQLTKAKDGLFQIRHIGVLYNGPLRD